MSFGGIRMSTFLARTIYFPTLIWDIVECRLRGLNKWDVIEDGLWLGAFPARKEVRLLHDMGVRGVLNTCEEREGPTKEYATFGINQLRIPVVDFVEPTLDEIKLAVDFIETNIRSGRSVYAHCKSGRGRSATIVLCWLMQRYQLSPASAQLRLQKLRGQVRSKLFRRAVVQAYSEELKGRPVSTDLSAQDHAANLP